MLSSFSKKIVVLPLIFASSAALANTYSFDPTNPNQNNQNALIGDLFQLEVLSSGSNQVTFEFTNNNTDSSAIIAAYIGGPNLFTDNSFVESAGVDFEAINQRQPQTGFDIEAA